MLDRLGVWRRLAGMAAPLEAMRIVDATNSLFRPAPVVFRANELALPRFGFNVPNDALEAALRAEAQVSAGLEIVDGLVADVSFSQNGAVVRTGDGAAIAAALVVAGDGRRSRVRQAARIGVRETRHPQHALTAFLHHEVPHCGISTEFHTRQGPCTLVPLPDGPDGAARSSLVWVMSPAEADRRGRLSPEAFAAEIERQCGRLLGRMTLESPIGRFPIATSLATRIVAERTVLIGEAAHALPPIGAQGLNLSLRDAATLVDCLGHAPDPFNPSVLSAYSRARRGDIAARVAGVGLLNGSLLSRTPGVDLLRGAGLLALGHSSRLRRMAMHRGLVPAAAPARPHAPATRAS